MNIEIFKELIGVYSIGLDLGIASVGWSVINSKNGKICDLGVRLFSARNSENNLDRRTQRGARRLTSRKVTRLKDTQKLLLEYGFETNEILNNFCPYELRVKGLTEQLTKDEIYVVVTHIIKKRGISYLDEDDVEGEKESQSYKNEVIKNKQLLSKETPGQIQLTRLKENGRVKTGINNQGNYQLNVFTVSAYAKELELILTNQQQFYNQITDEFISKLVSREGGLVYRKRPYYHGPGNKDNPSEYGRWADYPLTGKPAENIFDKLIGKDIIGELRASGLSLSAQKFNFLNDLNNLTLLSREEPKITTTEKEEILEYAMTTDTTFGMTQILKILGVKKDEVSGWRLNKNDKPEIHTLASYRKWRKIFLTYDIELNQIDDAIVDKLAKVLTLNTELDGILKTLEFEIPNLDESIIHVIKNEFKELGKPGSNKSWHSFSLELLNKINPYLLETSMEQNTIIENELGIKKELGNKYALDKTLNPREVLEEIYNPTVNKTVNQAIKVMNQLVKIYGKDNIDYVTIEMPRDKNEDEERKTIQSIQKNNEKRKKDSETYLLENSGWDKARFDFEMRNKGFARKVNYYYEQGGKCAYTGKAIKVEELLTGATEIDHIIPLSISLDDSINNKVLVFASANQEKGQRSPYQAFKDGANLGRTWDEFKVWVNLTYKDSSIKKYKVKRNNLLNERNIFDPIIRDTFISRNLNDTRYASRVVLNTLQSFFKKSETKVRVVTGSYTHTLRKKWGDSLDKIRDTHHHHAVDATLCAVSPFVKETQYTYFVSEDGKKYMMDIDLLTGEIREKISYQDYKKRKYDERKTYIPAWDNFIEQLKPINLYPKIKFSHQVDKKWNRKVSDATIYSTRERKKVIQKRGKDVEEIDTMVIDKIKDIYTTKGWEMFKKKKDDLVMKTIDPKTYEILLKIAEEYPDFTENEEANGKIKRIPRSPFEMYRQANQVAGIQKYSKKGNGPIIRSIKYYDKKLGNHINITKDPSGNAVDQSSRNKQVVLLQLNPWRTDVYYNHETNQYELAGIKYNDLKFIGSSYGIPQATYQEILEKEKIGKDSNFCFSLYRNNLIRIEYNDESIEGLFHARNETSRNYFEMKPIGKVKWENKENLPIFGKVSPTGQFIKPLKKDMKLSKLSTDVLGNKYLIKNEKLKNIIL